MSIAELARRVELRYPRSSRLDVEVADAPAGLRVLRHAVTTSFESSLYEPVVCLILQGRKLTTLGTRTLASGPSDCLLVSHDLPVVARVVEAPYLALIFPVDVAALRALAHEVPPVDGAEGAAVEVHAVEPALEDALGRLLGLAEDEVPFLGPLLVREIHYRLLRAPFGGMLRSLVRPDSHASAIARAIAQIRRDFRAPIAVPELARSVGMSPSSFHQHFRAVTASTPLQYQKELRLLAARRLLATAGSVAEAAWQVGYQSPNQFSREYARKFGIPPRADRAAGGVSSR